VPRAKGGTVVAVSDCEAIRTRTTDFLLAEHAHAAESLLRNEESGEKRATFFVSVAAAAAAVFPFAFGREGSMIPPDQIPAAVAGGAVLLFLLGLLTIRRLIERHIVTDRYIFALRSLRRAFLTAEDAQALPNAFFGLYKPLKPRQVSVLSLGKGGWLETIAFVNALFAALAGASAVRAMSPVWPAIWPALAAFAATWSGQILYARKELAKNVAELIAFEAPKPGR
jgi:hypothetical protein